LAKFLVVVFFLLMEVTVFFAVFVLAGLAVTQATGVRETLPVAYLLKSCAGLFLTMLPSVAAMWAITVAFEKPLPVIGLNLLLVIPAVLVANTPIWIAYPYCYSGYLVSCSLHDFTVGATSTSFQPFPFVLCAALLLAAFLSLSVFRFGEKETR